MSNELLAAFGITDEDLKEAKEEKRLVRQELKKRKLKRKKGRNMLFRFVFVGDADRK